MKNSLKILTLIATVLFALPCQADSYETISGSGSWIKIHKGETALVIAGAGTIAYKPRGRDYSYIQISNLRRFKETSVTIKETVLQYIPLVGPATIMVQGRNAFLGMRIVSTGTRPVTDAQRFASVPPIKSAVRP